MGEILEALEDTENSDYSTANIFICPPDLQDPHENTDEDSGDEDCQDPDRLSRRQLQAPAEVQFDGRRELANEPTLQSRYHEDFPDVNSDQTYNVSNPSPSCSLATNISNDEAKPKKRKLCPPPKLNKGAKKVNTYTQKKAKKPRRDWEKGDLNFQKVSNNMGSRVITLTEESHPLDFLECFMSEELVDQIVRYSVIYAAQKNKTNFELDIADFYTFLGILYLTGYVPLPRKRMYWENSDDVHNSLVSNSMRRNRFDDILRFIHFCDNDEIQPGNKMAKIQPILDKMNDLFLLFAPAENKLSIDESMIPYFGRHSCKQFIRGKPIRFGFKAWVLAARNGYCLQAEVYQGKKNNDARPKDFGLGESVVLDFCNVITKSFPTVPFSFYFDNFFTSAKLITKLGELGMTGTGTVRVDRLEDCPLPEKKVMMARARGSYESYVDKKSNIVAVAWKDNSVVTLLSNEHGVSPIGETKRYSLMEKKKVTIPQPALVGQYNRNMGGVDLMDNNISNYRIAIRGKRWYIPIIFWLFDVAMNNSWFLARSLGLNLDSLGFRRAVVQALLQKYGSMPKLPGPKKMSQKASTPLRLHHGGHLIVTGQPRRRCVMCKSKTVKACKRCDVPLHDSCFEGFHKE